MILGIVWWKILGGVALSILEAWLGKTNKLESGSTLELLGRVLTRKTL